MEEEVVSKNRVFLMPDGRRIEVDNEDVQAIFKGLRPRLMDLEDFKVISKVIQKEVARYLQGSLVHLSKVNDTVWREYTKGKKIRQKGHTYIKKTQKEDDRT